MTAPTIAQVDDAVRAVLAGIRRVPAPDRRRPRAFAGRLLSARHVEMIPPGEIEFRIGLHTVVTPIARDMLKRRGITLRTVSDAEAHRRGEWGFAIEDRLATADAIRRAILEISGNWNEVGPDVVEAAQWVSGGSERGAVVITSEASVANWLATQIPGVRSATVVDADAVARAVDQLGANLLVIEPQSQSLPSLKHCLNIFRKHGAPEPPDWLVGGNVDADWRDHRPGDVLTAAPFVEKSTIVDRRAFDSGSHHRRFADPWRAPGALR